MNALSALRVDSVKPSTSTASEPAVRECVQRAVHRYLEDMNDHPSGDLYELVLREVEAPLFAEVLRHYEGNQTRAAAALGIHRATLRKKLRLYRLA
ncbi:MAG TPA: DNA-binding transcriptional regulator Fis [Xanthomonadaceae bacterium]|nr:DNA-binding transcriptional regulator Fis [Xanthomonadaceae bacterium]